MEPSWWAAERIKNGTHDACRFYREIDVAVAWHPPDIDTERLMFKPAERIINPVSLGVPTIVYKGYDSFSALSPLNFQCDNALCVHNTSMLLQTGKLLYSHKAQHECVAHHVNTRTMRQYYESFFLIAWHHAMRVRRAVL